MSFPNVNVGNGPLAAGLSLTGGFAFRGADLGQHFLRFAGLPLRVVEAFVCLAEVELAQARLRFLDASDREVQPFAHFTQPIKLGIFAR